MKRLVAVSTNGVPERVAQRSTLDLNERDQPGLRSDLQRYRRSRCAERVSDFVDGLASMLETGVTMPDALEALGGGERRPGRDIGAMAMRVRCVVVSGGSLADGMRREPDWFDEVAVAMVEAGETSGRLSEALRALAGRRAHASDTMHRIASACAYPATVAVAAVIVLAVLSTHVLPALVSSLRAADVPVPSVTRLMLGAGSFVARWWWAISVAAVAMGVGIAGRDLQRLRVLTGRSRLGWELFVARFTLATSELVQAGLPLAHSLQLVGRTFSTASPWSGRLAEAANRIESGNSVVEAFEGLGRCDTEFHMALCVGQRSGELGEVFGHIGRRYERRARRRIDRLVHVLEPGLILILSAVVGVMVLAAMLPLIRLQEAM